MHTIHNLIVKMTARTGKMAHPGENLHYITDADTLLYLVDMETALNRIETIHLGELITLKQKRKEIKRVITFIQAI